MIPRSLVAKSVKRTFAVRSKATVVGGLTARRYLAASAALREKHDLPGHNEENEGTWSRTSKKIQFEYPNEEALEPSRPVQGRGGMHFKRTLASFSLEGKVGIVTGGARGLGLVMAQALAISGADVAIVDMNSMVCMYHRSGPADRLARGRGREAGRGARTPLQGGESGC